LPSNLRHNERVKLRAGLFNAAAGSCFTVGVAAPIAAGLFYGASNISLRAILAGVIFWLLAAYALHRLALRALRSLKDDD
jgi:hypothetical protein